MKKYKMIKKKLLECLLMLFVVACSSRMSMSNNNSTCGKIGENVRFIEGEEIAVDLDGNITYLGNCDDYKEPNQITNFCEDGEKIHKETDNFGLKSN